MKASNAQSYQIPAHIVTQYETSVRNIKTEFKNIDKILHEEEPQYSRGYSGRYDRSYDYSYARRGRDGDGDGRYNEGRSRDYSMGEYSREGNHRMVEKLHQMMETSNDRDREAIQRVVHQLEHE